MVILFIDTACLSHLLSADAHCKPSIAGSAAIQAGSITVIYIQ